MSVDASLSSISPSSAHLPGRRPSVGHRRPSGSMPYLTQRYALPIHHAQRSENGNSPFAYGEAAPRAESTLRRKTPNGTLNAGYDGSGDELIQPHKHQLLPLSEGNTPRLHSGHNMSEKRTFLQHQHQQQQQNAGLRSWHASPIVPSWPQPAPFAPPQNHFPVMDSMLHQMPAHHNTMQPYHGQTVPSVVQPSFQYLGPTASGGQGSGPYGPYWHDGTFVPYRPAAIRDPRFYQHHSLPNYHGSLPSSQHAYQSNMWQQQHQQSNQSLWTPAAGLNPFAPPPPHFTPARTLPLGVGYANTAHIQGDSNRLGMAMHAPNDRNMQGLPISNNSSLAPDARRREETFQWALQHYRDLLAFIHHTRRQQQQTRQAHGQQQIPLRPSFYPKPPKPSASGPSALAASSRDAIDSSHQGDDGGPPLRSAHNEDTSDSLEDDSSTPRARSPSAQDPDMRERRPSDNPRRASHDQFEKYLPDPGVATQVDVARSRILRRSTGSSISAAGASDDLPPFRATIALNQITEACRATEWQWTDGIHLGGCLAYALGDYKKALRWFRRVLENDSRHLEASSNLAATLLALGRRTEAEQYWQKVVKAAPNHFEAVEHLVGLLCTEQRSKDAIKVIEWVERSLRHPRPVRDGLRPFDRQSQRSSSTASRSPAPSEQSDRMSYEFDADEDAVVLDSQDTEPGFGSSGFNIPGCDNGRILALIHAKGNMLYALGNNAGAAKAFEDAVMIATGRQFDGVQGLVKHILNVVRPDMLRVHLHAHSAPRAPHDPVLLAPDQALSTARRCFPGATELPGLQYVQGAPHSLAKKAVISTTSNTLLSLAKIYQDGMSNAGRSAGIVPLHHGVRDILALYYLSLSLQPSPSTANNVGILLASVQQTVPPAAVPGNHRCDIPGVIHGSGVALALQYYNYGLQLDQQHAHLYTNLGSLLKDIGQLDAAINMYERAVACDGRFDIALANLANAVKDKGRISDAIGYYKRAVEVNPDFAEAVCGLANALNSVCGWQARGGIAEDNGKRDRWHVDSKGMLLDARQAGASSSGWIKRVLDIVEKQLLEGEHWGTGTLDPALMDKMIKQLIMPGISSEGQDEREAHMRRALRSWAGKKWEGARITRLVERATRRLVWQCYQDLYVTKTRREPASYNRPQLPAALFVPTAPTVLPFHTFTCPMSAKQIRLISQRNGLRISVSTLRAPWLPKQVFLPPSPPAPFLRVGYVSSDFNNHPLAHLMQSVFGLHDTERVEAYCYATTASDNSVHRRQIEAEAPVFHDASTWSPERLVKQIVADQIHILVNLNGYTRGARNEVFAARPAPIQMSFMGFAGTMGAEWCDYLLADETAVPVDTLRPWRRNVDIEDKLQDENSASENDNWVYGENIIYSRDTFFCCDHKQSAPDAGDTKLSWHDEQSRRWQMRKELFPQLSDDIIIFGNFNQLYKIEPTTFRTWLRILARVPNSILWLLRFPDLGESHLLATARMWAGKEVASRVIFTDVAPKHLHISRARVCDLVLDTAECNAHTTAADVLWSGTPLLTLPRYQYKMCSRMAASILKGALPKNEEGKAAEQELIAKNEEDYEEKAVLLGKGFSYAPDYNGKGSGRIMELRKVLFHARWKSALFDTKRWVRDLEDAYDETWKRWVAGEGGDIWLDQVPRGRPKSAPSDA
ncbi:Putative tetratricopeptide-like helical domain superfamily, O-GlcNAc transferase [Septoria linicola]|uniref:protein O-GlcNAc transferase n=1 Tax=Septoria linicola TaxID=215465 RepID=A0A9Q9AWY3_9PEZI|nr:putative tetratricopeptide-like helical domain superfamily, O-GlcNAc transferase [Septoria linicola]USW53331.1 Putative tetratricopeptide-like helical domain superfamily, O-GlcNAc transferase [Septoria linicola]